MVFQSTNTQQSKPYLQGQLLDDALLTDMISLIYQSRRQAKLNLEHGDQQFQRPYSISLYFMNGQVAYASSSNPYHRLGAILIRRGVISEFELSQILRNIKKWLFKMPDFSKKISAKVWKITKIRNGFGMIM